MKRALAPVALVAGLATALLGLSAETAQARPPEGGYFAFGLGAAFAGGDRGVPLEAGPVTIAFPEGSTAYEELIRTDFGSGLAFDLRFGWLIGPIAPEIGVVGHGTTNFEDGAGYPTFALRFHPLVLVDSLTDLAFDASVFLGAGYAIGGYSPDNDDDGKGWEGWALTYGIGLTYDLSARVRIGLDTRFVMPQYSTFMIDWDDDVNADAGSTPSTLVIIPTLQISASF